MVGAHMVDTRQWQRLLPLIGLSLLVTACKPAGSEAPAPVTSIVGAVLLDGTGGPPISDSVVTIEAGRIRAAGSRSSLLIPPDADKIDGSGKFIVPAVIDVARLASMPANAVIARPRDADSIFDRARREHLPVIGEIFSLRDARAMVARGAAGLLHMIRDTDAIDPAFITQLRDLRIVFIPMLSAEHDPAALALAKRNTKRLADAGVPMAVGSTGDTNAEMAAMVEAGLPPAEVLVAATRNGALVLAKNVEQGTIEPGKRADLWLLNANPVEDVRNFQKIARTMQDGQWQTPARH